MAPITNSTGIECRRMIYVGHDLRGHTNEVHANELRRRQEQSTATDRALMYSTNVVQETASQAKQQAATGQCPALAQTCCVLDSLHVNPFHPGPFHPGPFIRCQSTVLQGLYSIRNSSCVA